MSDAVSGPSDAEIASALAWFAEHKADPAPGIRTCARVYPERYWQGVFELVDVARECGWSPPAPASLPVVLATCGRCGWYEGEERIWCGVGMGVRIVPARCSHAERAAVVSRDAVPPSDCPMRAKERT